MSQDNRLENVKQLVQQQKLDFEKLAKIHGAVNFLEEASFAMQVLQDNDFLCKIAMSNQDSFRRAVLNVAIIGLSLNPYKREAYLVPRKVKSTMKICLDPSYIGYMNMFINIGAIQWCATEIHRQKDDFTWLGFDEKPAHRFDPSEDRGRIKGCYVCAKLPSGDILSNYMKIDEIYRIRDRYSESWKSENRIYSPWVTNEEAMIKKTVVRNAKTFWPFKKNQRADDLERIAQESDPIALNPALEQDSIERRDLILRIRTALEIVGWSEEKHLAVCARAYGHPDLKNLDELTMNELNQALRMLNQEVDEQNAKEKK